LFAAEVIVCSLATVIAAVVIMILKVPPSDEIARARAL
jgi:hypothetical protein